MPVTRKMIQSAFLKAETILEFCWKVLIDLKTLEPNDDLAHRFIAFQDALAEMIFNLQKIRDRILIEEKKVISNKSRYNQKWFVTRLRQLAKYKEGIDKMVNIAKTFGDAYAYFFYQNDVDLFSDHHGHERVVNHTAGLGERGELEFLRKVKHIDGSMTLYHGITNILRYGDFSFIDLKRIKVTQIGELKTSTGDDQTLNLDLHIIKREERSDQPVEKIRNSEMEKTRRGRQLLGIANFLKQGRNPNDKAVDIINPSYAEDIDRLVNHAKINGASFTTVSHGLAFMCIRFRKASLYKKLFKGVYQGISEVATTQLSDTAIKLMKKGYDNNGLIMGQLLYNPDLTDKNTPGTVPLFWSHMSDDTLRKLFFIDCTVISFFNPAHLITELQEMGFTIESKYVKKQPASTGDRKVLQRFDLFISFIINFLMTESFVVEAVKESFEYVLKNPHLKVSIRMQQHMNILTFPYKGKRIKGKDSSPLQE